MLNKFKNKNVLIMGLGVFGGGVASAKWFLKQNANVLITDLRDKKELSGSLKSFTKKQSEKIIFELGKHRKKDFIWADIIVVNPAIPKESKYLKIAKENGATLINDTSIFFNFNKSIVIGVTGTRGKTTTTNWIAQLLSKKYPNIIPTGNTPQNPLLKTLNKNTQIPVIAELSSWQLEFIPSSKKAPHIAIITNISRDHMNRYTTITQYANAKANIFKYQKENNFLILNFNNEWTQFLLDKKPKAQIYFFSQQKLPISKNGIFIENNDIIFQKNNIQKKIIQIDTFKNKWGSHNTDNLLCAILSIILFNKNHIFNRKDIDNLKNIKFRQETVYKKNGLEIINDGVSTSPEALISSVKRFSNYPNPIFIVGGTDKKLDFKKCASIIKIFLTKNQIIFLEGSATTKLIKELQKINFFKQNEIETQKNLQNCIKKAFLKLNKKPATLIFSPGGSSFEKFKNEFDRSEKFNQNLKTSQQINYQSF